MTTTITRVSGPDELKTCQALRYTVFVEGQQVPLDEELDGKDKDSEHYLLRVDADAAGTARVRYLESYVKIERVAVLDHYQGRGLGKRLMMAILADLANNTMYHEARLSSQTHAIPFYEGLGFVLCSDEYLDAGIPHRDMLLRF